MIDTTVATMLFAFRNTDSEVRYTKLEVRRAVLRNKKVHTKLMKRLTKSNKK